MAIKYIIVLFVETPHKFITAKLSIRKPGSSSVLIICDIIISTDEDIYIHIISTIYILLALMKIWAYGSKAVINLCGVSTNKTIIDDCLVCISGEKGTCYVMLPE
jgi:hypothetical protein